MNESKNIIPAISPADFRTIHGGEQPANLDISQYYKEKIQACEEQAIGHNFWFIADTVKGLVYDAGGAFDKLCNFKLADFVQQSPQPLFDNTHPDDLPKMFAFSEFMVNTWKQVPADRRAHVHPLIFVRLMGPAKYYYWAMVKFLYPLLDDNNLHLYCLTFVTDINHIKSDDQCFLTILDHYHKTTKTYYCEDNKQVLAEDHNSLSSISPRELQILQLIAKGNSSKQIASVLNISIKTVDNHRQSLLRKLSSTSSADLVMKAFRRGYIN